MDRNLRGVVVLLVAVAVVLSGCGHRKTAAGGTGGSPDVASAHGTMGGGEAPATPPATAPPATAPQTSMPPMAGMPGGAPIAAQTGGSPHAAAGLTWTIPARWTTQPERTMRVATYSIPAAAGDEPGTECAVFYFGANQGGGVDANIERWIGQFAPATDSKRSAATVNGLSVTRVEVAGTYTAPSGPMMQSQGSKPDWRLLGAIVEGPQGAVFFKLTGPAKSVTAARAGFDALLKTIRKE